MVRIVNSLNMASSSLKNILKSLEIGIEDSLKTDTDIYKNTIIGTDSIPIRLSVEHYTRCNLDISLTSLICPCNGIYVYIAYTYVTPHEVYSLADHNYTIYLVIIDCTIRGFYIHTYIHTYIHYVYTMIYVLLVTESISFKNTVCFFKDINSCRHHRSTL